MTYEELAELHNINPVVNLGSILAVGIVSHDRAAALPHRSVAMSEIQDLRKNVVIPNANRRLHSYANLYINARNKMMYKRNEVHRQLCVIRIDKSVLRLPGVVVADQNASSGYVRFGAGVAGLSRIAKETVFARSWKHQGDPIAEIRHGSAMCAEVLVPDVVGPEYIGGVYVSCDATATAVRADFPDLDVQVNADIFFKAGGE